MTNKYERALELGMQADRAAAADEKIRLYQAAWQAVPDLRFEWELGTWIWNSLCTVYVAEKNFDAALEAVQAAEKCHGGEVNSRTAYQHGVVLLEGFADERGAARYFRKASQLSNGRELKGAPRRYRALANGELADGNAVEDGAETEGSIAKANRLRPRVLSKATSKQIDTLCERGNKLLEAEQSVAAIETFTTALRLLPLPQESWEAFTWIWAAIGDAYFIQGDWDCAAAAFKDALTGPGGIENPFIHLRLGQCAFESGQVDLALDSLLRAYMLDGADVFAEEPKYFAFLKANVEL